MAVSLAIASAMLGWTPSGAVSGAGLTGTSLLRSSPADAGGLIAFESAGDIWVIEPDGLDRRRLTDEVATGRGRAEAPTWSADGSMLAYTRDGSGSAPAAILVVGSDGDAVATVQQMGRYTPSETSSKDWLASDWRASWNADGGRLAYSIFVPKGSGWHQVFVASVPPGPTEPGWLIKGTGPVWSPDGRLIAYSDGHDLHVVSPDGAHEDRAFGRALPEPGWSRDGGLLAYALEGADGSHDIVSADMDDGSTTIISGDPADEIWPAWSPDDTRVAFLREVEADDYRLVIVDLASGDVRVLATPSALAARPVWSPDGSHIAVWTTADDGQTALIVLDFDGSGAPVTIPADSHTLRASWQLSPTVPVPDP